MPEIKKCRICGRVIPYMGNMYAYPDEYDHSCCPSCNSEAGKAEDTSEAKERRRKYFA